MILYINKTRKGYENDKKKTYRLEVKTNDTKDDILDTLKPHIKKPFTKRKIFFVSATSENEAIRLLKKHLKTRKNKIIISSTTFVPKSYRNLPYKNVIPWNNARTIIFI